MTIEPPVTTGAPATSAAVTRRIDASAARIFALLCDPSRHVEIDGSTMLRSAAAQPLTGVGTSFVVEMWNQEMGPYEMTNRVVEFDPDRLIAWEPTLTRATQPEHQRGVGTSALQVWRYELAPVSETVTDVTETFDCSRSPQWLQTAVRGGEQWLEAITATLERLDALAVG